MRVSFLSQHLLQYAILCLVRIAAITEAGEEAITTTDAVYDPNHPEKLVLRIDEAYVNDVARRMTSLPAHETLRQEPVEGYLCMNNTCYDSYDQEEMLGNIQLHYLYYEPLIHCRDLREDVCSKIKDPIDDCARNPTYLHSYCPRTCNVCHNRTRVYHSPDFVASNDDNDKQASATATTTTEIPRRIEKYTIRNTASRIVYDALGSDLGVPQIVRSEGRTKLSEQKEKIKKILDEARYYMTYTVNYDDRYLMVRDGKCRNLHQECASWALKGECDDNHEYMSINCAPVCFTCHELHYTARCPIAYNDPHAWYPGDLNKMFERIATHPYYNDTYNVTVVSRPSTASDSGNPDVSNVISGPWLIVLEDFITPEEAQKLIEYGAAMGYERSEDVDLEETGEVGGVISNGRTSENSWCDVEVCEADPLVQNVIRKLNNLTDIPWDYTEHFQLLKYETNQFYGVHHDYTLIDKHRQPGCRILTVFLYLNDVDEANGGGTNFPHIGQGVTVQPKVGRAVLWPSVLNHDPHNMDLDTEHQAFPVLNGGIKYGANVWYHQRKFRVAYDNGCS